MNKRPVSLLWLLSPLFWLCACTGNADAPAPTAKVEVTQAQGSALSVQNAHMFALAPGQKHAAVYLQLVNPGKRERELLGVSTPIAGVAMVHRTYYEEGMMRMRHINHLRVPAEGTVAFEPNGYHIMLMDLAETPAAGDSFTVELLFDEGEALTFLVAVKPQH